MSNEEKEILEHLSKLPHKAVITLTVGGDDEGTVSFHLKTEGFKELPKVEIEEGKAIPVTCFAVAFKRLILAHIKAIETTGPYALNEIMDQATQLDSRRKEPPHSRN
jgi:hypothetical protein